MLRPPTARGTQEHGRLPPRGLLKPSPPSGVGKDVCRSMDALGQATEEWAATKGGTGVKGDILGLCGLRAAEGLWDLKALGRVGTEMLPGAWWVRNGHCASLENPNAGFE